MGCEGFKSTEGRAEIKRMFVNDAYHGLHIGEQLLIELEKWAKGVGFKAAVFETDTKEVEAEKFYKKLAYTNITNFRVMYLFKNYIIMNLNVSMNSSIF